MILATAQERRQGSQPSTHPGSDRIDSLPMFRFCSGFPNMSRKKPMWKVGITCAILGLSGPAAAQDTACQRVGNTTFCHTPTPDNSADINRQIIDLGRNSGNNPYAEMTRTDDAAASRSAAFAQVGALIAKGDCEGAARLSTFYGWRDLIKATQKACAQPSPK